MKAKGSGEGSIWRRWASLTNASLNRGHDAAPSRVAGGRRRIAMLAQSYYLRDPRIRRAAEALAMSGYHVDVFCLRDAARNESWRQTVAGVSIVRLPLSRRRAGKVRYLAEYVIFFLLAAVSVTVAHLRRPYDLIHVHTYPDALVFAAAVPKRLGSKVLLDMHDPMPETLMGKFGLPPKHPVVRLAIWLELRAMRYADRMVTVNAPIRELFIRRGARAERIEVVMNLVDIAAFPRRTLAKNETYDRCVLIVPGTIAYRYGLDIAIRAVGQLRAELPGLLLRIIGEGDQEPELRRLVAALGIADRVEFVPPMPHEEIRRQLEDADIGLSPHRADDQMHISFQNKIYEFVAIGLPVIASRTLCLEHYYPNAVIRFVEPGHVDDLAAAILNLTRNQEERRARVEAGWALTEQWNWTNERRCLLAIVEQLIGPSGTTQ